MNENLSYPLHWPSSTARTASGRRVWSKFGRRISGGRLAGMTLGLATSELYAELRKLRASNVILSTDVPLRMDGKPRAGARDPVDPGAAVYFTIRKQGQQLDVALAIDNYRSVAENVYAIAKSIEAIRGLDRWGASGGLVLAAFRGLRALPPGEQWHQVLGIAADATVPEIERAFRDLARSTHPDLHGGDGGPFRRLTEARDSGVAVRKAEAET